MKSVTRVLEGIQNQTLSSDLAPRPRVSKLTRVSRFLTVEVGSGNI